MQDSDSQVVAENALQDEAIQANADNREPESSATEAEIPPNSDNQASDSDAATDKDGHDEAKEAPVESTKPEELTFTIETFPKNAKITVLAGDDTFVCKASPCSFEFNSSKETIKVRIKAPDGYESQTLTLTKNSFTRKKYKVELKMLPVKPRPMPMKYLTII